MRSINIRNLSLKVIFWTACLVVTVASLTPTEHLPVLIFDWWDKAQHALAFFIMGSLGLIAYGNEKKLTVLLGLFCFGACIEIAQAATGWRYGDLADLLADAVGLGISAILFSCFPYPKRWLGCKLPE